MFGKKELKSSESLKSPKFVFPPAKLGIDCERVLPKKSIYHLLTFQAQWGGDINTLDSWKIILGNGKADTLF